MYFEGPAALACGLLVGQAFLLTMCPKEDVGGRFCKLFHCGGGSPAASRGRADEPPGPGLEEFREGSSKLAEEC